MTSLDSFDKKLLVIVQKDCRISAEVIGQKIGLSTAAVQRRLKRLRENGVIEREVAVVNQNSVGMPMNLIVSVEMEREQANILDEFRQKADKHPNIQQCYYVTGVWDFILLIVVQDMLQFEQISHELFMSDDNIKGFETSVVMGGAKRTLEVPIP